jgi:hypothetical protein
MRLREIGCWEGETYEELVGLFVDVRYPDAFGCSL